MATTELDVAQGQEAADSAPKYRVKGRSAEENDAHTALGGLGLEPIEAQVENGYVDPGIVQVLYHRFDGRTVVVPAYMSPKLLAQRVPSDAPAEYRGKSAWSIVPTNNYVPGNVKCLLHADQDEIVKAEIQTIGLTSGRCTKAHIHTPFDLERHMELKHKREWAAIKSHREKTIAAADRDIAKSQSEAMINLVNMLTKAAGSNPK